MSIRSVSVSMSHSRPTSLSSTVLCLKISSSLVHIRSYWHSYVCDAFSWRISSIHQLLDWIGCNSVFYLITKGSRSIAQAVYMSPDLYSDSMYANVFTGSSPRALLPKRLLLPHLDVVLSIFSCSTSSAGFPICNLYNFMIIWHFSNLFLPFYAFLPCFLLFPMFTFVLLSPFRLVKLFLAINTACS